MLLEVEVEPESEDTTSSEANATSIKIISAEGAEGNATSVISAVVGRTDNGNGSTQSTEPAPVSDNQCSALEMVGIEDCPELRGAALSKMLAAKRTMLRQIVDVLDHPVTSPGVHREERSADRPLLLVKKLAVDEADAIYGAFEARFVRKVTDAGGWSPDPGGFNRWVERYHREVLRSSRPVLVSIYVSIFFFLKPNTSTTACS